MDDNRCDPLFLLYGSLYLSARRACTPDRVCDSGGSKLRVVQTDRCPYEFLSVHIVAGLRLCHAFLLAEPQGSDPQEPASDRCTGIFLYPCRGMSDFLCTDRCTLAENQQCALRTTGTGMLWMERLWFFSARNKNRVDWFQSQCNGRNL